LSIAKDIGGDEELAKRKRAEYHAKRWLDPEFRRRRAEYAAKYYAKPGNKLRAAEYKAKWQLKPENKQKNAEYLVKRQANPEYKRRRLEDERNRKSVDPAYKLIRLMRSRLIDALKNNYKTSSVLTLLGCSISDLKLKLEGMFAFGMTWENHGNAGWHIDHIRPLSSFDLRDPRQQAIAFHHTNLQPLWAKDNLSKSDRWDGAPNAQAKRRKGDLARRTTDGM